MTNFSDATGTTPGRGHFPHKLPCDVRCTARRVVTRLVLGIAMAGPVAMAAAGQDAEPHTAPTRTVTADAATSDDRATSGSATSDTATSDTATPATVTAQPDPNATPERSTAEPEPLPTAPNVNLDAPVESPKPAATPQSPAPVAAPAPSAGPATGVTASSAAASAATMSRFLLGMEVPPGTATRLSWSPSESFEGIAAPTPVLVVNGVQPGLTLCLTAAVHGDELNGIEIVRRVLYNLDPKKLSGTVVGVPIVNLPGFRRGSRYLPDRRDLNRFFPGNPEGSSASRIAHSFFEDVISHCDALVDLHTGSFYRTNLPQLRADLSHPNVLELTRNFGATVALHSSDREGTLRQAAVNNGTPAVTLEAGEPMRLQEKAVEHGVRGIQGLLHNLGMYKRNRLWGSSQPIYYRSAWVRADSGGILFNEVKLGEDVDEGELLGTVTDPITNVRVKIRSPHDGRVLGMALNQVVLPGFAAYRIGIQSSAEEAAPPADAPDTSTETKTRQDTGTDNDTTPAPAPPAEQKPPPAEPPEDDLALVAVGEREAGE